MICKTCPVCYRSWYIRGGVQLPGGAEGRSACPRAAERGARAVARAARCWSIRWRQPQNGHPQQIDVFLIIWNINVVTLTHTNSQTTHTHKYTDIHTPTHIHRHSYTHNDKRNFIVTLFIILICIYTYNGYMPKEGIIQVRPRGGILVIRSTGFPHQTPVSYKGRNYYSLYCISWSVPTFVEE